MEGRGGEGEGRGWEGRGGRGGEGRGGQGRAGQGRGGEGRGLSTLSTNQNLCDRGAWPDTRFAGDRLVLLYYRVQFPLAKINTLYILYTMHTGDTYIIIIIIIIMLLFRTVVSTPREGRAYIQCNLI